FREVGELDQIVADNPVLLHREGYRDIYRAFLQFDLAAQLSWQGGEDVFGAGQRNVATLYEYWAFLTLGSVLSSVCNGQFDFGGLFESDDLTVRLKRGRQVLLRGSTSHRGRNIEIELYFNRF